jgi:hypothetical protein
MPTVSAALKQPCADPVSLPDTDLSRSQTARYWAMDRTSLVECGSRQKALSDATTILEKEMP